MVVKRPAWESGRLEEQRADDARQILGVGLSVGDQEIIEGLRKLWGIESETRILRLCLARVGSVELGLPSHRFWGGLLMNKQLK